MTFLSVWVNTADSRRGGETCRRDRGTSEGLGNSTGGNFLSRQESVAPNSVGWIPPHLSFENEFLLFWLIWLPQGPTRWASDQLTTHLTPPYMMAFPLFLQLPNTFTPLPLLLWIPAFTPPSPPAVLLLASTANAALSAHDGLGAARHLLPQPPTVPPRTSVRKQLSGVKREVDVCHCCGSELLVMRSNLPSLTHSHLFSQTLPSLAGSPAHPCGCCFQAWSWHTG